MKIILTFFLFLDCLWVQGQHKYTDQIVESKFVKSIPLKANQFVGFDNFNNIYYIKNNTLYKKATKNIFSYSNTQLGKITSVDITNPLKILLFYKDFNTVLFLDNQLNELTASINFTSISFSKNIAYANTASNTNLWLYSFDDNVLQSWNHQTKKVQFTTQSLSSFKDNFAPIKQLSTYKYCLLIGESSILQFNAYGAFIKDYPIDGTLQIQLFKEGFLYLKNNQLYYQNNIEIKELPLKREIMIRNFSINGNHLYIFDGTTVYNFKILKI